MKSQPSYSSERPCHDDVYDLLEVLAQKNMEGKSLKEIVKYAKEIGKNV